MADPIPDDYHKGWLKHELRRQGKVIDEQQTKIERLQDALADACEEWEAWMDNIDNGVDDPPNEKDRELLRDIRSHLPQRDTQ